MNSKNKCPSWVRVNLEDKEMCNWMYLYIAARIPTFPAAYRLQQMPDTFVFESINAFLEADALTPIGRNVMASMYNASKQKMYRKKNKKNKKQQYNFVLDETVNTKLNSLSKRYKKTKKEMLRSLIEGNYNYDESVKKKQKQESEKLKKIMKDIENNTKIMNTLHPTTLGEPLEKLAKAQETIKQLCKDNIRLTHELASLKSQTESR